ncbi:MAG: S-adenosylmethionine:tRNA ribosyltransferase-isomerase, partial [Prevotella sp.]|nr:S-adenosylmethionine:tRNA ribosyltransferase-isomerase [Prevotella sp.]
MDTKNISISDFNYELPDERIAKFPVTPRDHSQLLVYDHGHIIDDHFFNLPQYLPKGALMVFNNTKVIRARLHFRKDTGALIEVFLLEPYAPAEYEQMFLSRGHCQWLCLVGNLKKWKEGTLSLTITHQQHPVTIHATRGGCAQRLSADQPSRPATDTSHIIDFTWPEEFTFAELLEAAGQLPIPPYLNRETQQSDLTTYQTVYSKIKGSVAAPTAGLHFTPEVLAALDAHGIDREELTLHVGAGTFKPVKSETMGGHVMHSEHICVHRQTLEKLLQHDCQAIAVGTTSVRTLESLYYMGLKVSANPDLTEEELHVEQWEPYEPSTLNAQPSTLNPQHLTLNSQLSTLNSQLSTLTPQQTSLNPQLSTLNSQRSIQALLQWMDRNDLEALHASTQIIIAPGYDFHIVRYLVTNFHQPQSTLLLLVSAFTKGRWRDIYRHALD